MYYLAYGMNTNRAAMAVRCPKAKPMGGFYLPSHRLVFRGVADFRKDQDCVMPVVLWNITFDCLQALDRLEGEIQTPSKAYYDMIEEGYKDFGLDDFWLRSAREEASYRRELVG